MKIEICALVLVLAGCVGTSDVVPMGKDSFLVAGRAAGGLNSGKSVIEATKQANAYCAKQGKLMIARHTEERGNAAFGGESSQLIFSCVDPNDPEYKRPDWHRDPNTVIEDQRKP